MNKRVRLNDEYDGPDGDLICKLVVMHGGYTNGRIIRRTFYRLNKKQQAWIDTVFPQVPFVLFRQKYHALTNIIMLPNEIFVSCLKEPFLLVQWNFEEGMFETEFVINVTKRVIFSVSTIKNNNNTSIHVDLAYFNVSTSIENNYQVSVYITRKQG